MRLIDEARKQSEPQPRFTNKLGHWTPDHTIRMKVCLRHDFELDQYPTAISKGWPTNIDFGTIVTRMAFKDFANRIKEVFASPERSRIWLSVIEANPQATPRQLRGILHTVSLRNPG